MFGVSFATLKVLFKRIDVDHDALTVFARLGFFLNEDTPFRGISAMPPGGRLEWRAELPSDQLVRVKPGLSVSVAGPTGTAAKGKVRTRCKVPLSGMATSCTLASTPMSASLALRLSASAGFWKAPAWMK